MAGGVGVSSGLGVNDADPDVKARIFGVEEALIVEFCVRSKGTDGVPELQEIIRKTTNKQTICNCTLRDMNRLFIFFTNSNID